LVARRPHQGLKTSMNASQPSTRVPVTDSAEETKQALNLLIHDLRAPLSVAQGYLRLLSQNRLETDADRARAITQTMEALGRITRLCEDAAAFVADEVFTEGPASTLQLSALAERVSEACAARCSPLPFLVEPEKSSASIRLTQLERVVQSVAVILCAVRRSTRDDSVRVSVHGEEKEARFLLGCDEDRAALVSHRAETFDPWRGGHGIALPLACRTVAEAGGRIWTCANGRGAVGIALPEEASVP
jgi:signal transduction histidine kinase